MSLPTETDQWVVDSASTSGLSLHLEKSVAIPTVGHDEALLEIKAVSLNYRDIAIARGEYLLPVEFPLVPASDAAAVVLAVGSSVTSLSVGDSVCILPAPLLRSGHLTAATDAALGDGRMPGALRQYAVLPASWLAPFPSHLTFVEASTIGGAGVTAWNTLFGSGAQPVRAGDWVLTQGTGAVSVFSAAFAVLSGANVVATTSSEDKRRWLEEELGVHKALNYGEDKTWGETAKKLTPGGEGVDLVVDVGGPGTLEQSLKAIRYDGAVAVVGFLAGGAAGAAPSVMDVLPRAAIVRGIRAGSREHYEQMAAKMSEWQFHPVVDKRVFRFEEAKEAYEYLWHQKHVGKVVIEVSCSSR